MAWRCTGKSNAELVSNLAASGLIKNERVMRAMSGVDRANYCPYQSSAYEDSPQSIGHSATISAPHMHASACESLLPFLHPTACVLDVGSGSGYLTHIFANLITQHNDSHEKSPHSASSPISSSSSASTATIHSPTQPQSPQQSGKVIGVDHLSPLVEQSKANMSKSAEGKSLLETGRVLFVRADGRKGYADGAPYDAIHVGAAAHTLHDDLLKQLGSPGRMFIPVEEGESSNGLHFGSNQYIWVVDKDEHGNVSKKRTMGVRYVPLTDTSGG